MDLFRIILVHGNQYRGITIIHPLFFMWPKCGETGVGDRGQRGVELAKGAGVPVSFI